MEETNKTEMTEMTEPMKTVDIENKSAKDIFAQVYGDDIIKQAEVKNDLFKKAKLEKSKSGFVNKGLDVDTNARLSVFAKEVVFPNDWTESTMNLLEAWRTACVKSSEKHANAARVARRKNRQLSIPSLIIGTVGTALSFFSAGEACNPEDESQDLKYAVAAFTSAIAILGGISSLYSFSEKMQQNISAAGSFANLARRMEVQIFLPNHLRAPAEVVLTDVGSEFASLTNTSPLL